MKTLIQELKKYYIPPLTNLYFERIALEKLVFGVPLFVRISDPDSWRVKDAYQKLNKLSKVALKDYIENLQAYLTLEQGGSIFEGCRVLTLDESIPYIEWQSNHQLMSSSDLLGQFCLFIDALEFSDEKDALSQYINGLQSHFHESLRLVLIGDSQYHECFKNYKNLIFIDPEKTTYLSFAERFKFQYKNSLTLFNFGSKPYFLMNAQGKLMTFFTKQDLSSLMSDIKKYI